MSITVLDYKLFDRGLLAVALHYTEIQTTPHEISTTQPALSPLEWTPLRTACNGQTSVRLSVWPSVPSLPVVLCCCGFAAVRPTDRRYQSIAAGPALDISGSDAAQHGAQQQMWAVSRWQRNSLYLSARISQKPFVQTLRNCHSVYITCTLDVATGRSSSSWRQCNILCRPRAYFPFCGWHPNIRHKLEYIIHVC